MLEFLPKDVREGLQAARKKARRKQSRLRVRVGDDSFVVLKMWEGGFALDPHNAPRLRGLVDLYDGPRHLYQCLIVASADEDGLVRYDFKRATEVRDRAALDFVQADDAPVALIPG